MSIYQILCLISIPSMFTLLWQFIFTNFGNKAKKHKQDNELLKLGVQALLRDRLMDGYRYYTQRGWITIAEKECYDNLYQKYHALGLNGCMTEFYEQVMKIPIR